MSEQQENPATINPLLQRIQLPGETFTLPSGGLFYSPGVLDPSVKNAEIHVHPMTTIDEIVMKTPDMLFSGKAVEEVFARCIPQIREPLNLLAKDVDFLLTCLRKISYGEQIQIEYQHTCENAKTHTYTIDITQFIRNAKRIDPSNIGNNFSVTLPNGQVVKIQPMKFSEFVSIMQTMNSTDETMTPEKIRDELIDTAADVIIAVDEITDHTFIREWLGKIPPKYTRLLDKQINESSDWGPDFDTIITCKDCKKKVKVESPLNPLSFFT